MNITMESSKTRVYRPWGLFIALLSILSSVPNGRPQPTAQANEFLRPPRANLVPAHWPDLTQLEPAVRAQLESLRAALVATVKNPGITGPALREAYCALGDSNQVHAVDRAAR